MSEALSIYQISASALTAGRIRMQVAANNLANIDTLDSGARDAEGRVLPYRRRRAVFQLGVPGKTAAEGVSVARIEEDPAPFRLKYDPAHPLAIREGPQAGFVREPNVNAMLEMVDMIAASRAYEANITAMETTRSMRQNALRILA